MCFIKKNRVFIILLLQIFILLCICIAIHFATPQVKLLNKYTSAEDVARYIYKYGDLPSNFITGKHALQDKHMNISKMIESGYNQGGDTFENRGDKDVLLGLHFIKEADIYTDREQLIQNNKRGTERLLYTTNTNNVRVFYTSDHYVTITEVSKFELYLTSNILWIAFCLVLILCLIYAFYFYIYKKISIAKIKNKLIDYLQKTS